MHIDLTWKPLNGRKTQGNRASLYSGNTMKDITTLGLLRLLLHNYGATLTLPLTSLTFISILQLQRLLYTIPTHALQFALDVFYTHTSYGPITNIAHVISKTIIINR